MATVTFKKSGVSAEWTGDHDSILELAEAHGLDLDYGCRAGNCTACQQRVESGTVDYPEEPTGVPDDGHELLCCSVPRCDLVIDA